MTERLAYSTAEVAAAIGASEGLVKRLLASGEIGSVKLGGRRLIPAAALALALEQDAPGR